MMNYTDARTALHVATQQHLETLAAYNDIRDDEARKARGTKAALSEAQKDEVKQIMAFHHSELSSDLEQAERAKAEAQYQFDIADNDEKNRRRELDATTADKWMTISERLLQAAQLNAMEHTNAIV